jgi:gamma-glutamylcyclotransferase (GGCT)/AIG2-like uncharacterized protein YtfP|tara:strand:+ start:10270 stop:10656 length:387 start_codon:yes stop_codon:yes gene_type:complete
MDKLDAVFVYGTLKKGGPLHGHLDNSELVHIGTTKESQWHMRSLGAFPAMTRGNAKVQGQVYMVNDETLKLLDYVEGVPNLYNRERIEIDSWPSLVWAYIYSDAIPPSPEDEGKIFTWHLLDNDVKVV